MSTPNRMNRPPARRCTVRTGSRRSNHLPASTASIATAMCAAIEPSSNGRGVAPIGDDADGRELGEVAEFGDPDDQCRPPDDAPRAVHRCGFDVLVVVAADNSRTPPTRNTAATASWVGRRGR